MGNKKVGKSLQEEKLCQMYFLTSCKKNLQKDNNAPFSSVILLPKTRHLTKINSHVKTNKIKNEMFSQRKSLTWEKITYL